MLVGNIRVPERWPNRETIPSRHSCENPWRMVGKMMLELWQNYGLKYIVAKLSGWWFQPLWKIWKSVGSIIPNIWKNKTNVPNHQPVMVMVESSWKPPLTIGDSSRLHTWAHSLGISWQTLADQISVRFAPLHGLFEIGTSSIHGDGTWMILDTTHKRQGKTYFWYWCKTVKHSPEHNQESTNRPISGSYPTHEASQSVTRWLLFAPFAWEATSQKRATSYSQQKPGL